MLLSHACDGCYHLSNSDHPGKPPAHEEMTHEKRFFFAERLVKGIIALQGYSFKRKA